MTIPPSVTGAVADGAGDQRRAGSAIVSPEVVLRDGEHVRVRSVQADDEQALRIFFAGLSVESLRRRFFTAGADLSAAARWAAEVDPDRSGLVALSASGAVVAHGVFVRFGESNAEVAFEVAEDHRRRGLAGALLDRLARAGREAGVTVMEADVLPDNADMLGVFRHFATHERARDGVVHVAFPTADGAARSQRAMSEG